MLAMLFVSILAAVFGYGLVALNFPNAAPAVGGSFLGFFWLLATRRLIKLRQQRCGPAPVGPLSPDEKLKARSKLLNRGSRTMAPY